MGKHSKEDDEIWISGEELYTEGSSDEENYGCKSRSKSRCDEVSSRMVSSTHKKTLKLKNSEEVDVTKIQSTSKGESSNYSAQILNSEDEESEMKESEISWKPKRDFVTKSEKLILDEDIIALRELQTKYPKWQDLITSIKLQDVKSQKDVDDFVQDEQSLQNSHSESIKSKVDRIFAKEAKKMQRKLREMTHLEVSLKNLEQKLQEAEIESSKIQLKNRIKLKQMLAKGKPETGAIARNSEQYFNLYSEKSVVDSDLYSTTSNTTEDSKSEWECSGESFYMSNEKSEKSTSIDEKGDSLFKTDLHSVKTDSVSTISDISRVPQNIIDEFIFETNIVENKNDHMYD